MEKREKIILVLLLVVVGYGAYAYLFTGGETTNVKDLVKVDELNRIKADVEAKLAEHPLTERERYRLEQSERPWTKDPFYDRTQDMETESTVDTDFPEDVDLRYTGYIKIGNEIMYAIVNSMEYKIGDELEVEGFYLFDITDSKIVIGRQDEEGNIVGQKEFYLEEVSLY